MRPVKGLKFDTTALEVDFFADVKINNSFAPDKKGEKIQKRKKIKLEKMNFHLTQF